MGQCLHSVAKFLFQFPFPPKVALRMKRERVLNLSIKLSICYTLSPINYVVFFVDLNFASRNQMAIYVYYRGQ